MNFMFIHENNQINAEKQRKALFIKSMQDHFRCFVEKKYFGTRKRLNEEIIKYIKSPTLSGGFWKRIKEIRARCAIPELSSLEDLEFSSYDGDECQSRWLSLQNKKTKEIIKREIDRLCQNYNLQKNFLDWLQDVVLYNQIPPWNPFYNWELMFQITDNPNMLKKNPLTVGEKKFIKEQSRKILNIKRRPPKNKGGVYKEILRLLNLSPKNRMRAFYTLETALKTLELKEKKKQYNPMTDRFEIFKKKL